MTCYYAGDFETTTNEEETEVWLSCFAKVIDYDKLDTFKVNTSLEDFLKSLYLDLDKTYTETGEDEFIIFFHNLKFDGSFLLSFFLNNDIECTYFINDMGVWYSITLEFPDFTLTFRDSLKILNFSIATMAGLFKMPIAKGTTPLLKHKPEVIKPEWIDYIHVDVAILARGIFAMYYEENLQSTHQQVKR
ncbi:DNA polymerase [Streptococcus phage SOCP]|uniref:DNA-directed DNA polymerase n=1 Tax=Streptococcus phage SOCP TaxID=1498213 RepID=A0A0B4MZG8_BPCP1|nr:DNA polymerase [Streptococcus phage SOCP]